MQELLASIRKNAIGLGLFAVVTAGAIAVAQVTTRDLIQQNIEAASARALNEIVPQSAYDNDLLNDILVLDQRFDTRLLGPVADNAKVHYARQDGAIQTLIFPAVAPDGYTTAIDLLVGVHANGEVAGVRVVNHRETPGLGDKIDIRKSDWITSFEGKSLHGVGTEDWAVRKDGGEFDQFTGATITPRAVVGAVKRTLEFFEQHQAQLLGQSAPANAEDS